jgi:hypothetical protein
MKHLQDKLTYANVVATLALFLVLAGGTAFAAKHVLAKNSVGTRQIKNNAITGAKIQNGAVTGAKISTSSLGTVPSATHADSANTANTANTATNAQHAASADQASTSTKATTAERVETLPAPEPIHLASLEPGCDNTSESTIGPSGFYKDGFGEVHLVGGFFCGTKGAVGFVLPPGFRPKTEILQRTVGSEAGAELIVLPTGVVEAFGSTTATLFGASFRTN